MEPARVFAGLESEDRTDLAGLTNVLACESARTKPVPGRHRRLRGSPATV